MSGAARVGEARRDRWEARVGVWIIKLLSLTWRIRRVRGEIFESAMRAGQPAVLTLWHGQLLPLLSYHRHHGVVVLISEHRDGEIIAQIAQRLGYETVRGSTSRGAARALVGLTRVLDAGRVLAITPDGPRGPAHSFAPGALVAAQRTGASVIPVAASATRAWRLKSWDRFMIPKPFARVTIAYGEPQRVAAETARGAAEETERFQRLMVAAEHDASA